MTDIVRKWVVSFQEQPYWWVVLILLPLVTLFNTMSPWNLDLDFWETAANIRSVAENPVHPRNPVYDLPGNTTPRIVPYTVLWGLAERWTGLDNFPIIIFAGIVNYLLFAGGLYLFAVFRYRDRKLPLYLLLVMLFVWGTGIHWANAYQLEAFLVHLQYVGFFAFAISFWGIAGLDRYLRKGKWPGLLAYGLISALAFLTHPVTGLFCYAAGLALALSSGLRYWKRTLLLQLVPVAGFLLTFAWPYFRYLDVFFKGTHVDWLAEPFFGTGVIFGLGPALAGLILLIRSLIRKQHSFVIWGFIICMAVYLLSVVFDIQIGGRFLFFSAFFLHLEIALYLREKALLSWPGLKSAAVKEFGLILFLFLLVLDSGLNRMENMMVHAERIAASPAGRYNSPSAPYAFLKKHLDSRSNVMMNIHTSWILPGLTGARITGSYRTDPFIMDRILARRQDVNAFLYDSLSIGERRRILEKYRVTHIVLDDYDTDRRDPSLIRQLEKIARPVESSGNIGLFEVIPESPRAD